MKCERYDRNLSMYIFVYTSLLLRDNKFIVTHTFEKSNLQKLERFNSIAHIVK